LIFCGIYCPAPEAHPTAGPRNRAKIFSRECRMKREPRTLAALSLVFATLSAIAIVAIPSHALTISPEETTVRTAYARASYAVELGTVNQAVLSSNAAGKTLTLAELQADLQANGLRFQLSNFKVLTIQEFGDREAGALVLESGYVGQPTIKIGDWSAAASEGPTRNVLETEALAKWGVAPGAYTSNPSPYTLAEALRINSIFGSRRLPPTR
jgi:hypothetical protein